MHDVIMQHYEHGICAFLPCFVTPLCHAPKIFPKQSLPYFHRGRIMHQLFVAGNCLPGDWVDHRVRVVFVVDGNFRVFHEGARCVDCAE